jgi:hypothetical protein
MRKLLVVVAALVLAGCGPDSTFNRNLNAWGTGTFPVANDGMAALYIVRDASPDAPPIEITIGRQSLVNLAAPNYARLDLPPSLYDLRAYGPQKNKELIITVAPGQTRFLLAQLTPDGGAELLELSQEQGRRLARRGERVYTPDIK